MFLIFLNPVYIYRVVVVKYKAYNNNIHLRPMKMVKTSIPILLVRVWFDSDMDRSTSLGLVAKL